MSTARIYGAFTKVEQLEDGTLYVEGIASSEARDGDGELIRASAIKAALPDYLKFPALREMHKTWAAGRTVVAEVDDGGVTRIAAKVVDAAAMKKVKEQVYNGFSIGGDVLKRNAKDPSIIEELTLTEISLVDRPSNPDCVLQLVKIQQEQPTMKPKKAAAATETTTKTEPAPAPIAKVEAPAEPVKETPPAPAVKPEEKLTKAAHVDQLKKYLGQEAWDARAAIDALVTIQGLLRAELEENHPEGAEQIAALQGAAERLKEFIASEILEANPNEKQTAGTLEAAAGVTDLAKSFKNSTKAAKSMLKAHADSLEECHKALKKCHSEFTKLDWNDSEDDKDKDKEKPVDDDKDKGKDESSEKVAATGDLSKLAKDHEDLQKRLTSAEEATAKAGEALAKVVGERDALKARLDAKGAVRAVDKINDAGGKTDGTAPTDTLSLIKAAHSRPIAHF